MSNNFENLAPAEDVLEDGNETLDWELIRSDVANELKESNNPNLEGIDYNQLTEEDLGLWRLYKQWQIDGSGLTTEFFRHHQNDLRTQDIEGRGNTSSSKLSAYLADRLVELFYPKKK